MTRTAGTSAFTRLRRNAHRRAARRRLRARRRSAVGAGSAGIPSSRTALLLLSLPGLAAVAALIFTWLQVTQSGRELRIAEQGQITNRFNAAVGNLGSGSVDVRLGGVYALERIMNDSPRDQATIVSVLSAYVRRHAPVPTPAPTADIGAAMNVLVRRSPEGDKGLEVDLSRTDLRSWKPTHPYEGRVIHLRGTVLTGSDLSGTELSGADLAEASLEGVNFSRADLSGADLDRTALQGARLRDTGLSEADLTGAYLCAPGSGGCADLTGTNFEGADLTRASLDGADLRKATFCGELFMVPVDSTEEPEVMTRCATLRGAGLIGANLSGLDLTGADLSGADLTRARLVKANLAKADLTGADVTGADLTGAALGGAVLKGVRGLPGSPR